MARFSPSTRFFRRTPPQSRTMASGCVTRAGLATTTCTRSTVTPPSMVLLSRCTTRWLPATVSDSLASRSSRLLLSTSASASVKALNSSTSRTSGSHWCTGRSGHQPGSLRRPSRLQGQTCLCDPSHPTMICKPS